jgi:hypothetical protein
MVYLVGVDRQLQHNGSHPRMSVERTKATHGFADFLLSKGGQLKISLFAEEFNEDELTRADGTTLTVTNVARQLGVKHRFCEPEWIQRRLLGLYTDRRCEDFWLWYLGDYLYSETILLVCGATHLPSVLAKLRHKGVPADILSAQWVAAA